jgi:phosphodiesterase/alkaline phosphatase D-like protein
MTESASFAKMSELSPDFFINLGDLHYGGSNRSNEEQFAFAYHEVFKSKAMRTFYQRHPLVYTFDDHDVGDNNADSHTLSSTEVNKAYRDVVPHYKLGGGKEKGIW